VEESLGPDQCASCGVLACGAPTRYSNPPPPASRNSRAIHEWFELFQEIAQLLLVEAIVKLFHAGLLPISMAAPLSEKQRSAAFAAPHPLAWVDICAPLFASVPDRKSFYDKYVFEADVYRRTRRSFPRVRPTCCAFFVHRGSMDDETSWHRGRADFVQHSTGRWLCLRRLFQFSSKRCPSGFILLDMEEIVYFC